jgi:hypothetical protein
MASQYGPEGYVSTLGGMEGGRQSGNLSNSRRLAESLRGEIEVLGLEELMLTFKDVKDMIVDVAAVSSKRFAEGVLWLSQQYVPFATGTLSASGKISSDSGGGPVLRGAGGKFFGREYMVIYDAPHAMAVHENVTNRKFRSGEPDQPSSARTRQSKFLTLAMDELQGTFPEMVKRDFDTEMTQLKGLIGARLSRSGKTGTGTAATASTVGRPRLVKK